MAVEVPTHRRPQKGHYLQKQALQPFILTHLSAHPLLSLLLITLNHRLGLLKPQTSHHYKTQFSSNIYGGQHSIPHAPHLDS